MLTQLRVNNYRRFENFSLALKNGNILSGPNNSGKSSLIDALRIASACLRYAARRTPETLQLEDGRIVDGHQIPEGRIPVNLLNAVHNYNDDDASIELRNTEGARLTILLNVARLTRFFIETDDGRRLNTPSRFASAFPESFTIVPTLGALEQDEKWVQDETIQKGALTRLSSRHLRNVWYRKSDREFDEFAKDVSHAWSNITIHKPERRGDYIDMYFSENRLDREVYWSGFGFQIWLQILTHLHRTSPDNIVVIDEPDIYLHPDVQKRLMRILRERYVQFVIATHSVEIINDAAPLEIVTIDPEYRSGRRIRSEDDYARLYQYVGSSQNAELARVAKSRKVVFVEGKDRRIIAAFARRLGFERILTGVVPFVELGGFGGWEKAKTAVWAIREILSLEITVFCLFDRDYRSAAEMDAFEQGFRQDGMPCFVMKRKEIENYLLEIEPLTKAIANRAKSRGVDVPSRNLVVSWLLEITDEMKDRVLVQTSEHLNAFLRRIGKSNEIDEQLAGCRKEIEAFWSDLHKRLEVVPGKEVLKRLNDKLQDAGINQITAPMILAEAKREEVSWQFADMLAALDEFCA